MTSDFYILAQNSKKLFSCEQIFTNISSTDWTIWAKELNYCFFILNLFSCGQVGIFIYNNNIVCPPNYWQHIPNSNEVKRILSMTCIDSRYKKSLIQTFSLYRLAQGVSQWCLAQTDMIQKEGIIHPSCFSKIPTLTFFKRFSIFFHKDLLFLVWWLESSWFPVGWPFTLAYLLSYKASLFYGNKESFYSICMFRWSTSGTNFSGFQVWRLPLNTFLGCIESPARSCIYLCDTNPWGARNLRRQ